MNIDNLTLGELKKIAAMFGATQPQAAKQAHPFVGEYVIARCCSAGVHAGVVVSVDGENVILANSRRLWSWQAKGGIALSGVAQHGINGTGSKLDVINPLLYLTGVCELIPMTDAARDTINEYK